jgi:hypothetical protein
MKNKKLPSVEELALELFNYVEEEQGFGFVSSGGDGLKTHEQFFNVARAWYKHSKNAVKKIEVFLKKYDQF